MSAKIKLSLFIFYKWIYRRLMSPESCPDSYKKWKQKVAQKVIKNEHRPLFIYKSFIAKFEPAAGRLRPIFGYQSKTNPVLFL